MVVTRFLLAPVLHALLPLHLQIEIVRVHSFRDVGVRVAKDTAAVVGIVNFAVLPGPFRRAVASVVAEKILANGVGLLAGVAGALVSRVDLAVRASCPRRAVTSVPDLCINHSAGTAVQARLPVAVRTGKLAVVPVIVARAEARVSSLLRGANAAVLTRRAVAEVHLHLAVASHVAGLAVAVIVVDQLHAVLGSRRRARIGQALVDITLASRSHEAGRTFAFEAADLVAAGPIVVTSADSAVVHVQLAYEAQRAGRAGAAEVADKIVTRAAVLTRIRPTVVHVELAVLPLETFRALTLVRSDEVLASGAVLTGGRVTLVHLLLTVRTRVPFQTVATMTVANVLARAVVTQILLRHSFPYGRVLAGDHLHVADLAGPARGTVTLILVLVLNAGRLILAGTVRAPIDVLVASSPGVSVRAVASVILNVVVTRGTVQAR